MDPLFHLDDILSEFRPFFKHNNFNDGETLSVTDKEVPSAPTLSFSTKLAQKSVRRQNFL